MIRKSLAVAVVALFLSTFPMWAMAMSGGGGGGGGGAVGHGL